MPQTKFFRDSKALALSVPHRCAQQSRQACNAEPDRALDECFDLFANLDATEEQLDFPHLTLGAQVGVTPNSDGPRENLMRCSIWS
jgi:GTP-binding protein